MSCRQRRNACAIGSPRLGWLGLALTLLLLPVQALAQANQPPVADAGPDVDLILGEFTQLQGSGSDPDGDPIVSFLWTIDFAPAFSSARFSNPFAADPFFIPDVVGEYVLSLVVSDGMDLSLPDTMTIQVADNLPPVAIALSDVTTGPTPLTVNFDGSQSFDPEGEGPITFDWNFSDGSPRSGEVSPTNEFVLPGIYLVRLNVTDIRLLTSEDTILITVTHSQPPPVPALPGPLLPLVALLLGVTGLAVARRRQA